MISKKTIIKKQKRKEKKRKRDHDKNMNKILKKCIKTNEHSFKIQQDYVDFIGERKIISEFEKNGYKVEVSHPYFVRISWED